MVGLTCKKGKINLYLISLDFEPETYWDRMQFLQEAILYRLVVFTAICSNLF